MKTLNATLTGSTLTPLHESILSGSDTIVNNATGDAQNMQEFIKLVVDVFDKNAFLPRHTKRYVRTEGERKLLYRYRRRLSTTAEKRRWMVAAHNIYYELNKHEDMLKKAHYECINVWDNILIIPTTVLSSYRRDRSVFTDRNDCITISAASTERGAEGMNIWVGTFFEPLIKELNKISLGALSSQVI